MQALLNRLTAYYRRIVSVFKSADSKYIQGGRLPKLKKVLLISVLTIIVVIGVVIVFISPIAKYLVEKYDVEYTGRKITMDWAYVNPFTGYIYFDNFKIYERNSDSVFISAKSISADIVLHKLLNKTYYISELKLDQPRGMIVQKKNTYNFDDLVELISPKVDSLKAKKPLHFSILKIKIVEGEFHYFEMVTPINYYIKKVDIESSGIHWDSDTIAATFSFLSGMGGGAMQGNFTINTKNLDYRLAIDVQKFDLNILEQYLWNITNYGYFRANLDAKLNVKGSFKEAQDVTFTGLIAINDFHAGDNKDEDYASFDKLALAIFELRPKKNKYQFDSLSLDNPYFKYERYDSGDNVAKLFVTGGSGTAGSQSSSAPFNLVMVIGNYIKNLSKNFFRSNYKLNRLAIYSGNLEYNDYSLSEKFSMQLNPLFILADSITKNQKRVGVFFKTGIQPYGNANVNLSIDPKDSSDFDLEYHLHKFPASILNPYAITYTSFPLDRGTFELNGSWHVRKGNINSDNHLIIIDPRLTKRLKNKGNKWAPGRLIMALIRESGNVIDYEIPITGDLKNPKFHLKDVILDAIGNVFVKPITTPYRMEVRNIETEIEKSLTLRWEMRCSTLLPVQKRFIAKMADFLVKNSEASITVHPQQYSIKEKEYILFFEAKKKYFLALNSKNEKSFGEADSTTVDKMSAKDAGFVKYINRQTHDSMLYTNQDKCIRLLGRSFIDARYRQLNKERENVFLSYFKDKKVDNRVRITAGTSVIPYNGFSFYKIDYKGVFPDDLVKANRTMNELNDEAPRNIFKKLRAKIKGQL